MTDYVDYWLMSRGSPYEDFDAVAAWCARNKRLFHLFDTAAEMRAAVGAVIAQHPERLCVIQNAPREDTLSDGIVANGADDAHKELSYGPGDWTHAVVWFAHTLDEVRTEVDLDHEYGEPLAARCTKK